MTNKLKKTTKSWSLRGKSWRLPLVVIFAPPVPSSTFTKTSRSVVAAPSLQDTKSTDYVFTISQQEVCLQIWNTLFDYPCLQKCPALVDYVQQCAQLSWSLHVQPTRFSIDITTLLFRDEWHSRTHTSDPSSSAIRCYLWPTLFQEGICVHRGSVLT